MGLKHRMNEKEIISKIAEYLQGTQYNAYHAIEKYELDIEADDLEEKLCEYHNMEQCPHCGTWVECNEMIPMDSELDDPDGYCTNCR